MLSRFNLEPGDDIDRFADAAHDAVYTQVPDPVFICWQDLP